MSYEADPILAAADKAAEMTGVPKRKRMADANQKAYRPRRQILLPMIALAGSIAGFAATGLGYSLAGASGPLFFLIALFAQYFGPVRVRNAALPYDEREQVHIWRSRTIGMGAALAIAIAGSGTVALFDAFLERSDAPLEMPPKLALATMWLLVTISISVTTISASLMLPKPLKDEDL
jgi:hypothetical protein